MRYIFSDKKKFNEMAELYRNAKIKFGMISFLAGKFHCTRNAICDQLRKVGLYKQECYVLKQRKGYCRRCGISLKSKWFEGETKDGYCGECWKTISTP